MRVELSALAESDLEEIADYIAQDSPAHAVDFIRRLGAKLTVIGEHPLVYRLRPEIGEDARVAFVGRYAILFRISDHLVRVERVANGARDLPSVYGSAN
ncbi:MAG TPA: type II toxin-antitoxin system RelE/ParE family toxin [Rhodanobacteraceae bacterium]